MKLRRGEKSHRPVLFFKVESVQKLDDLLRSQMQNPSITKKHVSSTHREFVYFTKFWGTQMTDKLESIKLISLIYMLCNYFKSKFKAYTK